MKTLTNPKLIAAITTAVCVASLVWLMNTNHVNDSLHTGLRDEKLKNEKLLSEKLLLERDIHRANDQLNVLKAENGSLDGKVRAAEQRLREQEAAYHELKKKQNASLASVKKHRDELALLNRDLESQVRQLQTANASLLTENAQLQHTVASLQEKNRLLVNDLHLAMQSVMDHTEVHAVKKRQERLTVKAGRTKKLVATFEVPASLKNLKYRLVDPGGAILSHDHGTFASRVVSSSELTASTEAMSRGANPQVVEVIFSPAKKLKPGLYKLEILNDDLYVGSMKVTLQ